MAVWPQACQSRLRSSDSIRCSIRCGTIRASKSSPTPPVRNSLRDRHTGVYCLGRECAHVFHRTQTAPCLQRRGRLRRSGLVAHPGSDTGLSFLQYSKLDRQAGRPAHDRRFSHRCGLCVAFEMTPEGIKLEGDVDRRITRKTGRKLTAVVVIVAAVAAGVTVFRFLHSQQGIEAAKQPPFAVAIESKSIAVLPFENLSEEKANAYFADGMQDEILIHLARIADLKVISRTSVMHYKTAAQRNLREIGQQLGVAFLLEGRVQRAANRVRVNAQLIDSRSDANVWAQTYDRDLADVFAIQSEIAKAIADQLQAKLSPNEKKAIDQPPTTDLAAFDLYSRAKSLLLKANFSVTYEPNLREAIELLDEAVKRDPSFFDAYCQLAYAHEYVYAITGFDHTPARLALAEAALQSATRLRPDAAETHLARAQYLYYGLRDYAGALAELEIARRALPNDPRLFEITGYILRRRGQQEEGLQNLQRAVELDPRNFFILQQIALSYQFVGRYADSIAA